MSENIDKDQVIEDLYREWDILHEHFRTAFMEAMQLRSFIVTYACMTSERNRAAIDRLLAKELPDVWRDVDEWRNTPRYIDEVE